MAQDQDSLMMLRKQQNERRGPFYTQDVTSPKIKEIALKILATSSEKGDPRVVAGQVATSPEDQELFEQLCHIGAANELVALTTYCYSVLEEMLKDTPQEAAIRLQRLKACVLHAEGKKDAAVDHLKMLYTRSPSNSPLMRTWVFLLWQQNRSSDAIHLLEKHVSTYAADIESLLELAHLYTAASPAAYEKAAYLYEQLLLLQPWHIAFYIDYANILLKIKNDPEQQRLAIKVLCKALEMDPEHSEVKATLSRLLASSEETHPEQAHLATLASLIVS